MSVAIEPLCFWEVAKLKTYHNKPQLSPPLIIHKETNYTSLYIHPKICLHQSLQWYIFRWKYIYIICGFFTVVCTVPFCPSIYAYIIFTLRESFESLERECGSWFFEEEKCLLDFILQYLWSSVWQVLCVSFNSAGQQRFGDWLLWKAIFFSYEDTACRNCKNICFGTDLHCSNVHSLISMAMIVTTNTSGPLW